MLTESKEAIDLALREENMVEEQLTDPERLMVLALLLEMGPKDAPMHPLMRSVITKIQGVGTVVFVRRHSPSILCETAPDPRE